MLGDSYLDPLNGGVGPAIMTAAGNKMYRPYYHSASAMNYGSGILNIPYQFETSALMDTAVQNPTDIKVVIMDGGGNDVLIDNNGCLSKAPPDATCTMAIDASDARPRRKRLARLRTPQGRGRLLRHALHVDRAKLFVSGKWPRHRLHDDRHDSRIHRTSHRLHPVGPRSPHSRRGEGHRGHGVEDDGRQLHRAVAAHSLRAFASVTQGAVRHRAKQIFAPQLVQSFGLGPTGRRC
jgi:hypothetical protein